MVVVAVMAVVASAAWAGFARFKPRASLASATAELQSLIHSARQAALANGQDVAVLFFPDQATGDSVGRVIVYRDGDATFFLSTGTINFASYSAAALAADTNSAVLAHLDLPKGVLFGPTGGMGSSGPLAAPLASVPVSSDCPFCSSGSSRRGAIRFDEKGRATFYGGGSSALDAVDADEGGASVTIESSDVSGQATLVILSETGAIQVIQKG